MMNEKIIIAIAATIVLILMVFLAYALSELRNQKDLNEYLGFQIKELETVLKYYQLQDVAKKATMSPADLQKYVPLKQPVCENCGAPLTSTKCEYCGTVYVRKETE